MKKSIIILSVLFMACNSPKSSNYARSKADTTFTYVEYAKFDSVKKKVVPDWDHFIRVTKDTFTMVDTVPKWSRDTLYFAPQTNKYKNQSGAMVDTVIWPAVNRKIVLHDYNIRLVN